MSATATSSRIKSVRERIVKMVFVQDMEWTQSTELCSSAVYYLALGTAYFRLLVSICDKQDSNSRSPPPRVLGGLISQHL